MHKFYCLYYYLLTVYLSTVSAQNGPAGGCVLPDYPEHGTYTVDNRPEAAPGQAYDTAFLTVTCDPGYGIAGSNITYCSSSNFWSQPVPQCTRLCTLTPHPSVNYFCKVAGDGTGASGTRRCNDVEPSGTIVAPQCKTPVYYDSGYLRNMRCVDGSWDHVAICHPDCGTPTPNGESLIINGVRAQLGELPWHAGIYDKTYRPFMQICGGSLVSTTVVISAAHCFWDDDVKHLPASMYAVALGKIYRPWHDIMDAGVQRFNVSEIKIPVYFMGARANFQADFALVILATPVVYATHIRPVCVDLNIEFDRSQLVNSNSGKVSGWGLTSEDGRESPVLLTAELPYVDVLTCIKDVPATFSGHITNDKICGGNKNGTTVCKGDSGGGFVFPYMDRGRRRYYLRGVVSTAPTSGHKCNVNDYTSFTHVVSHATFIKDNGLGEDSVSNGPVGRCVLPAYPRHGTYTVRDKPRAKPGQVYESVILTVTCDPGYGVVGNSSAACVDDNDWSESIPQCSQFCKLTPHPSVKYVCKIPFDDQNNGTRLCKEYEPSGTVVIAECHRPNYYSIGLLSNMNCVNASWDYVATCLPECGTNSGHLRPNSTHVTQGEMPWHAGIYNKSATPYRQICGGSLVSTAIVISAAHCFWHSSEGLQSPGKYAVALGKIFRPWETDTDPGALKSDISSIKVPDSFKGESDYLKDDIALVFLSAPVVYTAAIRPVCIDFDFNFDREQLHSSNSGVAAGWGVAPKNGDPDPALKFIELQYVPLNKCIDVAPLYDLSNLFYFASSITHDKNCAEPVAGNVCRDDGGGGVVYPTVDGGGTERYYLRGVLTVKPRQRRECNFGGPGTLFTRVWKHAAFLKKHLIAGEQREFLPSNSSASRLAEIGWGF